jgi:hypothetical protein
VLKLPLFVCVVVTPSPQAMLTVLVSLLLRYSVQFVPVTVVTVK